MQFISFVAHFYFSFFSRFLTCKRSNSEVTGAKISPLATVMQANTNYRSCAASKYQLHIFWCWEIPTTDPVLLANTNYRSSDAGKYQLQILCLLNTRLIPLFFVLLVEEWEYICANWHRFCAARKCQLQIF